MKLIVGLGNPEKKYDGTYHNIGFRFIDKLSEKLNIQLKKKTCKSLIGEAKIDLGKGPEKIILAKPLTYMNLSGDALTLLKNKFKIDINDIYIISDDTDLPIGKYRYREKGSAGTHNGLRHIVQVLKDENFKRIRIGIGKSLNMELSDYVLSKIPKENIEIIESVIENAFDIFLN